jgi:hypothetical protein
MRPYEEPIVTFRIMLRGYREAVDRFRIASTTMDPERGVSESSHRPQRTPRPSGSGAFVQMRNANQRDLAADIEDLDAATG